MPGLQVPQGELSTIMVWKESAFGVFPTVGAGTPVQQFHAYAMHQPKTTIAAVPRVPRGSIAAPLPGTGGRTIAMSFDPETDEDTFPQLLAYTLGAQTAPSLNLFTSTLVGNTLVNATSLTLASTNFLFVGQQLTVDTTGTPDTVTVTGFTGINTITFTPGLAHAHTSGATCKVTSAAAPHSSVMTMASPLPSFTLQVNRPGATSTDYLGSCVDQLTLSCAAKQGLKAKFSLCAQQVVNDASPITPTMSVLNPYIFEQQNTPAQIGGEVTSIGSNASLLSWQLTINNNFNKANFAFGSGNTVRSFPEQLRKVTGTMTLYFETAAQMANFNAAAAGGNLPPITMLIPLVGTDAAGAVSPFGLGIYLPNVFLTTFGINDDTSKATEQTVSFECGESTPGANDTIAITAITKNTVIF